MFKAAGTNKVLAKLQQPYSTPYLKEGNTSSAQFLKDISIRVRTDSIYQTVETFFYSSSYQTMAIQMLIVDKKLRKEYGGNYLFQVWTREGVLGYEVVTNGLVQFCNQSDRYIIYRPHEEDANSEFFMIVDTLNDFRVIKVRDWVKGPNSITQAVYGGENLILSTQSQLYVLKLVNKESSEKEVEAFINVEDIRTYVPGLKIHQITGTENTAARGDCYIYTETVDGQLDVNRFRPNPSGSELPFEIHEMTDYAHRPENNGDNLQKACVTCHHGTWIMMGLRKSGAVDFYVNFSRINSIEDQKIIDIDFDEERIFLKLEDGSVHSIHQRRGSQISWERARKRDVDYEWENIKINRCLSYAQPFTNLNLIRNSIFVAHGRYISEYKVLDRMWITHKKFSSRVSCMFRQRPDNTVTYFHPAAILENNHIFLKCDSEPGKTYTETVVEDWTQKEPDWNIKKGIKEVIMDEGFGKFLYLLNKENQLVLLTNQKLVRIEGIIDIENTITIRNLQPTRTMQKLFVQFEDRIEIYNIKDFKAEREVQTLLQYEEKKGTKYITKPLEVKKIMDCNINSDKDKTIFIDEDHVYHHDWSDDTVTRVENIKPRGMVLMENKFIYMLCKGNMTNLQGLYYIDGDTFFEQKKSDHFMLTQCNIVNGQIDYSYSNQRLAFFKSLNMIEVVPMLHQTSINLFSMPSKDKMLSIRRHRDCIYALTKENQILTWDITTGQQIKHQKVSENYSEKYEIFSTHESNKWTYASFKHGDTLLMSKEEVEDVNVQEFFKDFTSETRSQDQVPYQILIPRSFRNFRLVQVKNPTEVKVLREFIHPSYEGFHRIFFSDCYNFMFEQLENHRCFFYEWNESEKKWKLITRVIAFPTYLQPYHCYRSIQSPNLQRYIDWQAQKKKFVIKSMSTQAVEFEIPPKVMNNEYSARLRRNEKPEETVLRFKWHNNDQFIFCDNDGVERLFDLTKNFEEISFNKMPFFERENSGISKEKDSRDLKPESYAIYDDRRFIRERNQVLALKRISYQAYKRSKNLFGIEERRKTFDNMFHLVTGTMDNSYSDLIRIQLSFSYIAWRIMEKIGSGDQEINDVPENRFKEICEVITPQQQCILHFLDFENLKQFSKRLYSEEESPQWDVPFTRDESGETPLDIAIKRDDFKRINFLLKYLSGFGLDHHSRLIVEQMPVLIDMDLPNFAKYLASREFKTGQTKKIKEGILNPKNNLYTSRYTLDEQEYKEEIFISEGLPSPVEVKMLDIPLIHNYTSRPAIQLMENLSNTRNFEIFKSPVVKNWIVLKYQEVKKYTFRLLFLPFLVYLFCLVIYIDVISQKYRNNYEAVEECKVDPNCSNLKELQSSLSWMMTLNVFFQIVVGLMSTYFLINEIKQIYYDRLDYFKSFWNYIDLVPLLLCYVIIVEFYIDEEPGKMSGLETVLYSLTPFFTWLKGLYFMRIFQSYAYLIRMIVRVIVDMKTFLVVLLITIIAFADAFYSISLADKNDFVIQNFAQAIVYVYRMSLGDFAYDEFGTVGVALAQILFVLCTMFNMIVMFNLLIAIISETFSDVNSYAEEAGMQEKASMIAENAYLVPLSLREKFTPERSFLYTAVDLDDQIDEEDDNQAGLVRQSTVRMIHSPSKISTS